MADTLTYTPMRSTRGTSRPRVLRARFGDGYVQEAGDGINALLRAWELVFSPVYAETGTPPTLQDLRAFFEAQAGYKKFNWTQPPPYDAEGPKLWVCAEWEWTYEQGQIVGLRATLEQRPG